MIRFVGIDPLEREDPGRQVHHPLPRGLRADRQARSSRSTRRGCRPRTSRASTSRACGGPSSRSTRHRRSDRRRVARRPRMSVHRLHAVRLQGVRHRRASRPAWTAIKSRDPPQARGGRPRAAARREPRIGGAPAFAHVAKHARRTVNPPDDTWVAFALDKRGYKKHCHFKVAVSRDRVRFLFEVGPEHARQEALGGRLEAPHADSSCPVLRRAQGPRLVQERARRGAGRDPRRPARRRGWPGSADELLRTRDGQLVLGRVVAGRGGGALEAREYARPRSRPSTCWRRSIAETISTAARVGRPGSAPLSSCGGLDMAPAPPRHRSPRTSSIRDPALRSSTWTAC